jgi:hypothetical protein
MPRCGSLTLDCTKGFKLAAVRLSEVSSLQFKAVATTLGICPLMVRCPNFRGHHPAVFFT